MWIVPFNEAALVVIRFRQGLSPKVVATPAGQFVQLTLAEEHGTLPTETCVLGGNPGHRAAGLDPASVLPL